MFNPLLNELKGRVITPPGSRLMDFPTSSTAGSALEVTCCWRAAPAWPPRLVAWLPPTWARGPESCGQWRALAQENWPCLARASQWIVSMSKGISRLKHEPCTCGIIQPDGSLGFQTRTAVHRPKPKLAQYRPPLPAKGRAKTLAGTADFPSNRTAAPYLRELRAHPIPTHTRNQTIPCCERVWHQKDFCDA